MNYNVRLHHSTGTILLLGDKLQCSMLASRSCSPCVRELEAGINYKRLISLLTIGYDLPIIKFDQSYPLTSCDSFRCTVICSVLVLETMVLVSRLLEDIN